MSTQSLKDDTLRISSQLHLIEHKIFEEMIDLEANEIKWKQIDQEAQEFLARNKDVIIRLNVSGEKFATTVNTLMSIKDTLFYHMILSGQFDISRELFFDRSPREFSTILDFLRYKKISWKRFSKEDIDKLKVEAEYYEITEMFDNLAFQAQGIEVINFLFSGPYSYGGSAVGTNNVNDLKDKSLMKGICTNSPGWIIFELNGEWDIEVIEIAGYLGNRNGWGSENGASAAISTSRDKTIWTQVGTIPFGFSQKITRVQLNKTIGRYIKFQGTSYLGIGYLEVKNTILDSKS